MTSPSTPSVALLARNSIDCDNVDALSKIPDPQSWCTLPIGACVEIFGKKFDDLSITQYAAYRRAPNCLSYILRRCPGALDVISDIISYQEPQTSIPYPYPLLHLSVLSGNVGCVRSVVQFAKMSLDKDNVGKFINRHDSLGFTAMHFVAMREKLVVDDVEVDEAINEDADFKNRKEIAVMLIENGADLFQENCCAETPLITALIRSPKLFEFLADYLIQHNMKEYLQVMLTERREEYGFIGEEPMTLEEALIGDLDVTEAIEQVRMKIDPEYHKRKPSMAEEIKNKIMSIPVNRCSQKGCDCTELEELFKCKFCGKVYCVVHLPHHQDVCPKRKYE